jgi:hypothetical protein
MEVNLSALYAGRPLPPGRFLVFISLRGWVDPRSIMQLEVLCQLKYLITSSGIEPSNLPACNIVLQQTMQRRAPVKYGFYVKIFQINTGHYNEIYIFCVLIIVFMQRSVFEIIDWLLTKHGFHWATTPASETDTRSQLHEQRDHTREYCRASKLNGISHSFLRYYCNVCNSKCWTVSFVLDYILKYPMQLLFFLDFLKLHQNNYIFKLISYSLA